MTSTDSTGPVYWSANRALWRELLHQWLTGRTDRVLVLCGRDGSYQVRWGRQRRRGQPVDLQKPAAQRTVHEESSPRRDTRTGYHAAFHVELTEQHASRAVQLHDEHGPESVNIRVLWWVHDPAQVVRTQTLYGWDAVRNDIDRRLHDLEDGYAAAERPLNAAEVTHHLGPVRDLDSCGLRYRVTDVRPRDTDGELLLAPSGSGGGGFPYTWTANRREEYDFCLQTVRNGPVSLAALWLQRRPDQVQEVLNWSMHNQSLIQQETHWQDEMAGLLGKLTDQEQHELSKVLRDRLLALGRRLPEQGNLPGDASGPGQPGW